MTDFNSFDSSILSSWTTSTTADLTKLADPQSNTLSSGKATLSSATYTGIPSCVIEPSNITSVAQTTSSFYYIPGFGFNFPISAFTASVYCSSSTWSNTINYSVLDALTNTSLTDSCLTVTSSSGAISLTATCAQNQYDLNVFGFLSDFVYGYATFAVKSIA